MAEDSAQPTTLRPNRRVFIWRPIIRTAIAVGALALALHFFLPLFAPVDPGLLVWLGAALSLVVIRGINRFVIYGRTFYEFFDDRLVIKTGSIASRSTIDLPYRNVTQVVLRLPFIEHRFFSTGHLAVHAAGSSQGQAHLESIDAPRKIYDRIADHLRDNGFSLGRTERLQREKPHLVGTLVDTSGMAIGGLLALITVGLTVGGAVVDMLELANFYELFDVLIGAVEADNPDDEAVAFRGTLGLALLAVVGGVAGLVKLGIHFVDLNRRTYTLWDDVVDYEDGFLTETYKFIPIENLADTATVEPFIKRIFGMADVQLSPHGAASGIRFPSMPRAAKFRGHLDRLIESNQGPARTEPTTSTTQDDRDAGDDGDESVDSPPAPAGARHRLPDVQGPALEFGPSLLRRSVTAAIDALKLFAFLLIIAVVTYIAVFVAGVDLERLDLPIDELDAIWTVYGGLGVVAIYFLYRLATGAFYCWTTDYRVGKRKVTWERDFISRDEFEFTTDKITTLEVERDLVDRIMGYATITFWSIGNTTPLVFEDVARGGERLDEIRRRLGLLADDDEAQQVHRPRVNPLDYLFGRLYLIAFLLLLAAGSAVAATYWPPAWALAALFAAIPVVQFVHNLVYYPRCRLRLFEDHLSMRRGIFFLHEHYVAYDQIRSVVTTRYPARRRGTLQLVPGSSRRIALPYIDALDELHEHLDDLLYAHPMRPVSQPPELDRTSVSERQPLARNKILVAGLLTLTLTLITVIPTFLFYLFARRTSIYVDEGRVRRVRGILYRTTQTVLTNRIDQLLINRGPVHTLFRNGVVSVLTVGSPIPELRLGPVGDDQALYDEMEHRLPGKG